MNQPVNNPYAMPPAERRFRRIGTYYNKDEGVSMTFRVGEWVKVRSKDEILRTLDAKGQMDGLPFMPEMFNYCGRRFRVWKRAHKTCDTVNKTGGRRMSDAVHLEGVRCDGLAHGGCQASCLIFWKVAWLKHAPRFEEILPAHEKRSFTTMADTGRICSEEQVLAAALGEATPNHERVFSCQATLLPAATDPLPWWSPGQYIEDLSSGNVSGGRMLRGFLYIVYKSLINSGIGLGKPLRWLYDATAKLRGGFPYPRRTGSIPQGKKTPMQQLNLRPGDLVRVKSYQEILATLDQASRNRGLYVDAEMVPYCGRTYRVLKRVTRILDEKTGKMQELKNPCIILDGVVCEARYSECRLFCPRAIYSYWREIWLKEWKGILP